MDTLIDILIAAVSIICAFLLGIGIMLALTMLTS